MVLESFLMSLKRLGYRNDDDAIDRLHYFITSNVLIAFSVLVSWKQFGGKPIECMTPPKFPGAWEDYAENYCWAQDTYIVPFTTKQITGDLVERDKHKISYYQWVPFFLLLQAACFRAPSFLYKYLAAKSGITLHDLVELGINTRNIEPATRQENVQTLTTYLQGALRFHRRLIKKNMVPHSLYRACNLTITTAFVTLIYIVCKILYLANVIVQFALLNKFMEIGDNIESEFYGDFWGFRTMYAFYNGTRWEQTGAFPRVTICDFQVRGDAANIQRYSVQCVMVINIFNEKIFIFLWFWYLLLSIVTIWSLLNWMWEMFSPWSNKWFIAKHLELSEMPFDREASDRELSQFINKYLHIDGCFVIRMISNHAGVIFGTELILSLWRTFYGIEEQRRLTPTIEESDDDTKGRKRKWTPGKAITTNGLVHRLNPKSTTQQDMTNYLRLRKSTKPNTDKKMRSDAKKIVSAAAIGAAAAAAAHDSRESDDDRQDYHQRLIQDKDRDDDRQQMEFKFVMPESNKSTVRVSNDTVARTQTDEERMRELALQMQEEKNKATALQQEYDRIEQERQEKEQNEIARNASYV